MRYRAERDLYRINQEFRRLSIKPDLVDNATWRVVAGRYESLAAAYESVEASDSEPPDNDPRHELRGLVARAFINAAQVRAIVGDSVQVLENYQRVIDDYQDLPMMVAEIALAQGRLAESRRQPEEALVKYQSIVDRIQPQPGEPGVPGVVLELPLRIARLRAQQAVAQETAVPTSSENEQRVETVRAAATPQYESARAQYETWIQEHPGTRIELDSRMRLADLAADLKNWNEALSQVHMVENAVTSMQDPPIDPSGLRLSVAVILSRASAPGDSIRETLESILRDYPKSKAAPQALMALARQASGQGNVNGALDYLDRLSDEYPEDEQLGSEGMLLRARILEKDGRWPDALEVLRALPVQHPLSEAALQAPLEIAEHYKRAENAAEVKTSLESAEREYRAFIERYPPGPAVLMARTKLVQTMLMQERYDDAVGELLGISDAMRGNPQAARYMVEAARVAHQNLNDSKRAAEILEQVGNKYPNMQIGRWAAGEATRLRESSSE